MLRKLAIFIFSVGLIILPLSVQALGFGGIKLKSSLNEKLNAEVVLLSVSSTDIQSLNVKLATDEAFLRAGISRTVFLSSIKFKVKQYTNGDYYIHLTTKESVREPFLDFLLDMNWKNGRMLREYTMLLDPPSGEVKQTFDPSPRPVVTEIISPAAVVPITQPQVVKESTPEIIKPVVIEKTITVEDRLAAKKAAEIAKAIEDSFLIAEENSVELWPRIPLTDYDEIGKKKITRDAVSLDYGIVKENDNLWKIAEDLRQGHKNISIYQIMMALLQSNPEAFTDNNIHRLNVGHVLRINNISALTRLTRKEAANAYIKQTSAWNQYRQQVANTVAVQPIIASSEVKTNVNTIEETSGELTLSSPDGKSLVSGGGTNEESLNNNLATIQDQLRQTKADAGTMRSRNTELNEKLQLLEDELNRLQRSISIKDDALAALQHQLSGIDATKTVIPDTTKEPVVTNTTEVDKTKKSPIALAEEITTSEKMQVNTETDVGIMGMLIGIGTTIVGVFAGDSLLYVAALLLLILLVIIGIMIRRRRQGDKFQESILTGVATADNVADAKNDSSVFAGESSFLSDFAMSGIGENEGGEGGDSEVDPLAEADVFIAYGRFEAAEERLNEAVQKEPERKDLRAKILEVHHASKNKDAFESAAEKFYTLLGGNEAEEPLWQKIVDLGMDIAPENPLFVEDVIEDEAVTEEVIDEPNVASMSNSEIMDIGLETGVFDADDLSRAEKMDSDMDFNLDLDDELEAFDLDEEIPEEEDLEFDLELDEEKTTSEDAKPKNETDDFSLDFNLDIESTEKSKEESKEESTVELDSGNSLDFNLDMDVDKLTGEVENDLELNTESNNSLDFNMDETEVEETITEEITADLKLPIEESSDDFKLDINLDIETDAEEDTTDFDLTLTDDKVELVKDSQSIEEETSLDEDDDLELSSDEVGTKLDLAKAYIDMGDPEGARSILSEVMDEGSETQKEEAQGLLGQIV